MCIRYSEFDGVLFDYSRQRATLETVDKLFKLAEVCFCAVLVSGILMYILLIIVILVQMQEANLKEKIHRMYNGEHVSWMIFLGQVIDNLMET